MIIADIAACDEGGSGLIGEYASAFISPHLDLHPRRLTFVLEHVKSISTRAEKGLVVSDTSFFFTKTSENSLWTRNCSSIYKAVAKSAVSCVAMTFS